MHLKESNVNAAWRLGFGAAALGAALLTAGTGSAVAHPKKDSVNLRNAAVFSMSNARSGNKIVAFARGNDGRLRRLGSVSTGGKGSGSFEDTANGLVLGSSRGESSPNNLSSDRSLLFATNAGSDTIATFRVGRKKLKRVSVVDSGPTDKPVSLTVSRGLVYVLNSGEQTDKFNAEKPGNCADSKPTITGFRVSKSGKLRQIRNSTRALSERGPSGCAQVSFNPRGNVLVVTERLSDDEDPKSPLGDEGSITTYKVRSNGTLGDPRFNEPTGSGPFGFTFTKRGDLLTTEQFDGPMGPTLGAAASYRVHNDGSLTAASRSRHNNGTDTCWIVATDDGRFAFAASFFGDGQITSYEIARDGDMRKLKSQADGGDTKKGASDLTLSGDSRYLYSLNSFKGTIDVFRVSRKGGLHHIQRMRAQKASKVAGALGLAGI